MLARSEESASLLCFSDNRHRHWHPWQALVLADWPRLRRRFTAESAREINNAAILSALSEALVEFAMRHRS